MRFLVNCKLATRISIITTVITLAGMLLLWLIVSDNVVSIVKNDITNQMTDTVESRASIINDYVTDHSGHQPDHPQGERQQRKQPSE